MAHIYLSLGSNLGERAEIISQAIRKLELKELRVSRLYEAEPWGTSQGQPWFYNCAVKGKTERAPRAFFEHILKIEQELGRTRTKIGTATLQPYDPRTIDIDILFYDDLVINDPDLNIPHPHIAERRFVLTPLNEIAPDFVHPVLKKRVMLLLKDCTDPLIVRPLEVPMTYDLL